MPANKNPWKNTPTSIGGPTTSMRGSFGSPEFDKAFDAMTANFGRVAKFASFMAKYGIYVWIASAIFGSGTVVFVLYCLYRLATK